MKREENTELITALQEEKRAQTLVCVTDQLSCDRIIRSGRTLANMTDTDLVIINISTPQKENDPEAMEYLFRVSAEYGGEMNVIYSDNILKAIQRYIKEHKIGYVVTGIPRENDSVITGIWRKFIHIKFFMVHEGGELSEVTRLVMDKYGLKRA